MIESDVVSYLDQFRKARSGNVGIVFALAFVPIVVGAGTALDYSRASKSRTNLQALTDAAALAGAASPDTSQTARIAAAKSFFPDEAASTFQSFDYRPGATISVAGDSVTVRATSAINTSLLGVIGKDHIPIAATATGVQAKDGPPGRVLALNKSVNSAISFDGNTTFKAPQCGIYSNSSSSAGMTFGGSADVSAAGFCSVGGVSDSIGVQPTPRTKCAPAVDPFANLNGPNTLIDPWKNCVASGDVGPNTTKTLAPGVYCGGLDIQGTALLNPGLYLIKDGSLKIGAQASVTLAGGTTGGVTFYLTGVKAGFDINAGSTVQVHSRIRLARRRVATCSTRVS